MGLLGRAVAFAVVARTAGGDHIHPAIDTILGERNDVLTGEVFLMELFAAVSADTAITAEQLVVRQTWFKVKRVDTGHALGANDAVATPFWANGMMCSRVRSSSWNCSPQ